ncbi:hypothetical protein EDF62_3247 [Leucobacter luti]|uniref:Uncharacterized protein n=2 Tax=Leucobacter luti TaxID=340320 RepID=A0A4R6RU08_9MICO|nr:hypothetical protein EDF62_3247 [Leucobacter luti]
MSAEYVTPGVHRWGWASTIDTDGKQVVSVGPLHRSRISNAASRAAYRMNVVMLCAATFIGSGAITGVISWMATGVAGVFIAAVPFTVIATALSYVIHMTIGDEELHVTVDGSSSCTALRIAATKVLAEPWSLKLHDQVFMAAIRLRNDNRRRALSSPTTALG